MRVHRTKDKVVLEDEDGALDENARGCAPPALCEREFFIDNLLVRIHFIIVMIRWTGLAP